ncbi:MAG: NAD(P)-dependent oxidoreductase [Firmicutes bacterium]|uniref:Glutamate synthase (NADPH/NADH) small chain n=1 Tax=Melghirimyces thermohalophilus TaxID=1236220 RepID=A0A1G6NNB5_9BACL|nr:NAD(P)-dependent oxidoreductase [Melghirimyces thermohalophilus]MDA8352138.1 NAD(P)-dependent oxidoreductase [Bacillota bacterium]SDC68777.1 glutamate synthase (NADPH/NADH) small chain [Melghirimyces thermohalophilus]
MSDSKQPLISIDKLAKVFEESTPSYNAQEAIDESNRCLYCYDAPCITACPTGIDVPAFIKGIASGNIKGAAKIIMEDNPVGATCARVCPTEELCEGACVLNHSTKPIMIGQLQRYATDWAIKNEQVLFKAGEKNGKCIAIIGSGPAGLSAARELALLGYEVIVYEAKREGGGLDTHGIVPFRLPKDISLWEVKQVENLGVEIRTNIEVGKDILAEDLVKEFDAVILAVGMSKVPMLGIEGEELDGVYDAIDLVENVKINGVTDEDFSGKRVAVIGAGNTAIDGATISARLGAKNVKIIYRRTEAEMTAYDFEYEFAKQDGVEFRWLMSPKRLIGDDKGHVKQMECVRMELGEKGEDGRRHPVEVEDSTFTMDVDIVVKAIGQTRFRRLIDHFGLEHNGGVVQVDPQTYQTSIPKVYAAGDVIFGKGQGEAMVVSAAQQGKEAAYSIHKQLNKSRIETA